MGIVASRPRQQSRPSFAEADLPRHPVPRRISILGATGSIGGSTLDLVRRHRESFSVEAITAHHNVEALAAAARDVGARFAAVADPDRHQELKSALAGTRIEVAAGQEAIIEAAERPSDLVMAAIVGAAGLEPALAAIRRGAFLALANKETLVCAGELVMAEIGRHGATIIPVDSEHSAIFQILDRDRHDSVERITLTASGGPFRGLTREALSKVGPKQAVAHPNWSMGAKTSVDSATMMNKGLELIEAHHLFAIPESRLEILVHPQSIVHSLVTFLDGSVLAQMGCPDMRTPIAYALAWPNRMVTPVEPLDLAALGQLTFERPDEARFPSLRLARQALQSGGAAPTILNASNEVAVEAFLKNRIGFLDVPAVVERTLTDLPASPVSGLEDVVMIDKEARRKAAHHVGDVARRSRS